MVAARVRQVRKRREMTVPDLAARLAELGAGQITVQSVYKIEAQRQSSARPPRQVTVDELLALAAALNVAPVHLLVPPDDIEQPYRVTAAVTEQATAVRAWARGLQPLGDADPRQYHSEIPRGEFYHPEFGITGAEGASRQENDQ